MKVAPFSEHGRWETSRFSIFNFNQVTEIAPGVSGWHLCQVCAINQLATPWQVATLSGWWWRVELRLVNIPRAVWRSWWLDFEAGSSLNCLFILFNKVKLCGLYDSISGFFFGWYEYFRFLAILKQGNAIFIKLDYFFKWSAKYRKSLAHRTFGKAL